MHSSAEARRVQRLQSIKSDLHKQFSLQQRLLQFSSNHIGITIIMICGVYISMQVLLVRTFGIDTTANITRVHAQHPMEQLSDPSNKSIPLITTSPITRIVIPAADINAPVLTVGMRPTTSSDEQEWDIARYAVGHHNKTGVPGQGENIVFSSYASDYGRIFANLDKAIPGSTITVYEGDVAHNYTVVSQKLIKAPHPSTREQISDSEIIAPTKGEQVTFITCWPPSGSDRYSSYLVVIAKP
jgi:sortase (surface protein transpeptidase)